MLKSEKKFRALKDKKKKFYLLEMYTGSDEEKRRTENQDRRKIYERNKKTYHLSPFQVKWTQLQ